MNLQNIRVTLIYRPHSNVNVKFQNTNRLSILHKPRATQLNISCLSIFPVKMFARHPSCVNGRPCPSLMSHSTHVFNLSAFPSLPGIVRGSLAPAVVSPPLSVLYKSYVMCVPTTILQWYSDQIISPHSEFLLIFI